MSFVSEIKRTHYCGDLRASHDGESVVLMGWVHTRRDHGGLVFLDLRDRTGLVQIVLDPGNPSMSSAHKIRGEFVVAVKGKVRKRPEGMGNKRLATGEIEMVGEVSEILSEALTPPFDIEDERVHENLRLQYRYLDLRSPRLQKNMILRSRFNQIVRRHLSDNHFLEIETPILFKSTPEGARDYLVPSRVHNGSFYALPQSPQILKQLLMVSGYDRYFQIARCFRDEDLRADRQPEFTQIDLEMSFVEQEDVLSLNESLVRAIWKDIKGKDVGPIPRMSYKEAMNRYGNDKPDTRFGMELQDLTQVASGFGVKIFDSVIANKGVVKGICVTGGATIARAQMDKLTNKAKDAGGKGLIWIKWDSEGKWTSPISKLIEEEKLKTLFQAAGGKQGDLVLISSDTWQTSCTVLSVLRLHMGNELKLIDTSKDAFLWVVDFPLFEYDAEARRWMALHHPFTSPKAEHVEILATGDEARYGEVLANAYDLVCNGYEIGGGSIRIHKNEVQQAMFRSLGLSEEEAKQKFGFFLDALKYGTPPHGGFAWGVDRVVMILCGTDAIRDVIAFPKTAKASCLMSECPSPVAQDQLLELGIRLART